MRSIVAVPGSFDPLHSGHIELLKEASKLGNVIVILKGDKRLKKKKKKILMPANDRLEILDALVYVKEVVIYDSDKDHEDYSEALETIRPNMICFGEKKKNCLEPKKIINACKRLKIDIKYGVGGDVIHSSSQILKDYGNL